MQNNSRQRLFLSNEIHTVVINLVSVELGIENKVMYAMFYKRKQNPGDKP